MPRQADDSEWRFRITSNLAACLADFSNLQPLCRDEGERAGPPIES